MSAVVVLGAIMSILDTTIVNVAINTQGIGAALMMPFAGRATDRTGPGRVVLGGLLVTIIGMVSLTQVGAHTSCVLIELTLFVMGLGLGATMMPAMAAAYQTLSRSQVARATSALNIIQRVGADSPGLRPGSREFPVAQTPRRPAGHERTGDHTRGRRTSRAR